MASGLRPAAVRVLPLGLETVLNSSKSCTIPPGTLLQFDVESTSNWRRVGLGERVVPTIVRDSEQ
jgi:hypothetical protein